MVPPAMHTTHTYTHRHTHQGNAEGIIKLLHDNADERRDQEKHNEGVLELKKGEGGRQGKGERRETKGGEGRLLRMSLPIPPL